MEILNSGKKVEQCDPVARIANQQLIAEASTAGGTNFTNPVSLAGGTDRILFLHVVTGLNVNEPTLSVTNVDIGGITPTLLNTKTITTTGAGLNLEYTNSVYYILESDIASLGTLPIVTVDTDIPLSGVGGGVNVRATQYENVNQAAPFFATNQNCIDGTVPNPHTITVPSCENGLTHWQYSKASPINDSYNANNIMDGLIQASGLVQNTGYQEGDLTNPHELEINQLAGTFKGVIANGFNLFSNCEKFPELQCNCEINIETECVYEYRDIWAEEGAAVTSGQAEWSYGNGAVGFIGLPVDAGWEIVGQYFNSDTWAAGSTASIDIYDYTTPNALGAPISNITITTAATNNASQYDDLTATPVPVPTGAIIGFFTRTVTGSVSDARVGVRLRRKVGDFVTNVTIN